MTLYTAALRCAKHPSRGNRMGLELEVSMYRGKWGSIDDLPKTAETFAQELREVEERVMAIGASRHVLDATYSRAADFRDFASRLGPYQPLVEMPVYEGMIVREKEKMSIKPQPPTPGCLFSAMHLASTYAMMQIMGPVEGFVFGVAGLAARGFYATKMRDDYDDADFSSPLSRFGDLLTQRARKTGLDISCVGM